MPALSGCSVSQHLLWPNQGATNGLSAAECWSGAWREVLYVGDDQTQILSAATGASKYGASSKRWS